MSGAGGARPLPVSLSEATPSGIDQIRAFGRRRYGFGSEVRMSDLARKNDADF
jgi:hypothetical protein